MDFRWVMLGDWSCRLPNIVILTKHCRCFCKGTQGADGAAYLLEALSQSPLLEVLVFDRCSEIPAAAWQKFHGAKWLYLKTADFGQCLGERNGWRFSCFFSAFLSPLECTWTCRYFTNIFSTLYNRLTLTKFCRCFVCDTKVADGAADLLEALSQSPLLENLNLCLCGGIPAAAWQKVRSAKWLNLKRADFDWCLAERNGWRFSCLLRCEFVSAGSCWNSGAWWDLWSCRMSPSWPRRV